MSRAFFVKLAGAIWVYRYSNSTYSPYRVLLPTLSGDAEIPTYQSCCVYCPVLDEPSPAKIPLGPGDCANGTKTPLPPTVLVPAGSLLLGLGEP